MTGTGLGYNGISFKNYQSHSASSLPLSKAINSDSIVERAIQVCLEDFQGTIALPRVKMYPLVDLNSSESAIPICITVSFKYRWILLISQDILISILQVAHYS